MPEENKTMLPSTVERVPHHTADHINQRIRERTRQMVARAAAGGPEKIKQRLAALDNEWDIERVLEANAASVVLIGSALGFGVDRRFFALPAFVAGFLLQHALQGWCPPLPLFRRLGVRTAGEIEDERRALLAIQAEAATAAGNEVNPGPVSAMGGE
jgi:hypothetical protein